ncbi:MAG TPA: enoyl-CoA hydratase/isomerase family protein [Steroidobacteraceae bacterium]
MSFTATAAPVQHERRDGFWFARLQRPDKRNALSEAMLDALMQVCDAVAADHDARALVLWGAGGHFSAGGDFSRFAQLMAVPAPAGADPIVALNRSFGRVLETLAALPVPTLGVIRGTTMGGGVGLVAALDRVVAGDDAVFAMPEVTLGVAPAQIAPFVLRRVGATRARWLMYTGQRIDAQAALALGLVDCVAAPADLASVVADDLRALCSAEPGALRATKRLAHRSLELPLAAALDAAALDFATLLRSGTPAEGMAASRARRAPKWQAALPVLPEFT